GGHGRHEIDCHATNEVFSASGPAETGTTTGRDSGEASMALRIHFTFADLARTRVSHSTYPLQELSIAMRVLRDRTPSTRFDAWRRDVLTRLPTTARRAFEMT